MIVIGIDPGLDGAVAIIVDGVPSVFDTPVGKDGKKRRYLVGAMRGILNNGNYGASAAIERVHSMPKQGVASSFGFGEGFGLWQGLLAGLGIPFDLVTPQAWQKVMLAGAAKGKGSSRVRAQQLFPSLAKELNLVKHHGRSDALLIAEYRRRQG